MSSLIRLILIFFGLCFLVVLVYVLVVKAYYWGGTKEPTGKTNKKAE